MCCSLTPLGEILPSLQYLTNLWQRISPCISTLHPGAPNSGIVNSSIWKWFSLLKLVRGRTHSCRFGSWPTCPCFFEIKKPAVCTTWVTSTNALQTGELVEYTWAAVPSVTLILWGLVHHDSIAVSELLLLLPAKELQATEFAPARTSLSLFPKTSFTATQARDCLHVTFPETKALRQVQQGKYNRMKIPTWCSFKAFPITQRGEL